MCSLDVAVYITGHELGSYKMVKNVEMLKIHFK